MCSRLAHYILIVVYSLNVARGNIYPMAVTGSVLTVFHSHHNHYNSQLVLFSLTSNCLWPPRSRTLEIGSRAPPKLHIFSPYTLLHTIESQCECVFRFYTQTRKHKMWVWDTFDRCAICLINIFFISMVNLHIYIFSRKIPSPLMPNNGKGWIWEIFFSEIYNSNGQS